MAFELPVIATPRVLQAQNLPAEQEQAKDVYAKPAKPAQSNLPRSGRPRQKKTRSPVRPGDGHASEKDEKDKKVRKQKRKRHKSAGQKAQNKLNNLSLGASIPVMVSNQGAAVWRSRVDENVKKAKQQMTEFALHRLAVARKASEEQRARAREQRARQLQRAQNEMTQLPKIHQEEPETTDTQAAEPRFRHFRHSRRPSAGVGLHVRQTSEDSRPPSTLLDDESRPASVLELIQFNTDKSTRMQHLSQKRRIRSKMMRKQKFVEEQRMAFDELPEDEQDLLTKVFARGRSADELPMRLAELGIKGKDEEEALSISKLCEAYLRAGTDDLLTFAVNLVPVARRKLQEPYSLLCREAFQAVPKYGLNSGLGEEHTLEILQNMFVAKVSGADMSMMKRVFSDMFQKLMDPETAKIDCSGFGELMWQVREAYDRECAKRDLDVMEKFGINEFSDEVKNVKDELLALYSVLSAQTSEDEDGEVKFDIVDVRAVVGILTESGLCVGDKDEEQFIEERIHDLSVKGSLDFHDLHKLIEQIRSRALKLRRARDLPVFMQYDKNNNGVLCLQEAALFMKDLGLVPRSKEDQDELKWLLEEADADKSGGLDFDEFQYLVQKVTQKLRATQRRRESTIAERLHYSHEELSELREAFFALDSHQSYLGLDIQSCRRALELMRIGMTPDRLNELFHFFDRTGLGHLKFEEFLFFITAADKPRVDWKEIWRQVHEDEM